MLIIFSIITFYSEDNECGLLTVGSWYAMTGYGFAMAKDSKYLEKFNKKMIEYRENGKEKRGLKYFFSTLLTTTSQVTWSDCVGTGSRGRASRRRTSATSLSRSM